MTSTRRWSRVVATAVATTTAGTVLVVAGPSAAATATVRTITAPVDRVVQRTAAVRRPWPGHPGRGLVGYRVRRGDTATGLAVRFHAWTAELRAVNHLGRRARLTVGQRLRIPVVLAAVRRDRAIRHRTRATQHRIHRVHRSRRTRPHPWRDAHATRAQVRQIIVRTARRHHVDPHLALAVGWQESGWQQHRVSSAGAIGAMQVLPGTATWMAIYAGRRLNAYSLRDNVTAGVLLLRVLRQHTGYRRAVASYYQGLGSVRAHGLYRSTRRYTRNVVALHHRLRRGWNPL